jgi:hypothetical protein
MLKARVAKVKLGQIELEGIMKTDGSFFIAAPQASELFQFVKTNVSRDIKAILGEDFQFVKITTELHPKYVNCLTLVAFRKLMFELVLKGNIVAIELSRALVDLTLEQLFCDSFGVKFEAEDRQNWLVERLKGLEQRHELTDAIKEYQVQNGTYKSPQSPFLYIHVSDCVNKAVLGWTAKQARLELKVPKNELLRNHLTKEQLKSIDRIEDHTAVLIRKSGRNPVECAKQAIEFYS